MWRHFADAVRELRRSFEQAFDPYRPELHYMRGPGPKWRAKHAGASASAAPIAGKRVALRDIADAQA